MADTTAARYACYFIIILILTLWFALTPSREVRIRVADSSFKTTEAGDTRRKYRLSLALEQGKTYRIEETTRHTATTRHAKPLAKNTYEVLAQTEYLTSVTLDLFVESVSNDRIECLATLQDFVGYEEVKESRAKTLQGEDIEEDDGDRDEADRKNRNKEMFAKVREETRGVEFKLVLNSEGTVEEMETSKLREKIISALHEVGQLPMHLEHAVMVGGYHVFPANGASFGPQGRTSVRAPVYRMVGTGCKENHPAFKEGLVKNRILIVNRGDCTFNQKALIAAKNDAAAMVVVDTESQDTENVLTYMAGEADVPIVSVIVNKEAGETIEEEMKERADFAKLANGDMIASDRDLVEILGGVEAVQALNDDEDDDYEEEGEDNDDEENKPKSHVPKKRLSHAYTPIHSDGLHDFVGIGYVVDEVIRTRFSIFPDRAVTIGSSWERSFELSDGIDPTVRAEVMEKYKLAAVSRSDGKLPQTKPGDLIAEIEIEARERPAPEKPKEPGVDRLPINPDPDDDEDEEGESIKITPQFARPSFRGHDFSTKGLFQVDLKSGLVLFGESDSVASSERTVVIINKKTKKRKTVRARVDIVAATTYTGLVFQS